ncbi:MAG: hypothetical protein SGBAC_008548 [Bacillariaceae sp.]
MPPRASLLNHQDTSLEDFRTSDVIFGTRGNGGNSSFLSRLEETADHYSRLSKYEKMECIKNIIADWHGRFFIITPDGSCSQVYEFEASPSSKLYTSVRRMMNYVIKKKSVVSVSPGKQRMTNSRERKRLRRIKVLERFPIHQVQVSDHSEEEASDISVGNEDLQDQQQQQQQPSFNIQRIATLEDSAIHVLVSLIHCSN